MPSLPRTFSAAVLAAAALVSASGVQAQTANYSLYGPGSSYVGVNVGRSDYSLPEGAGGFGMDRHKTTYGINTGSFATENFGMEVGYTHFGDINRAGGTTKAEGLNLSLLGRAPLSPQFNLLGKLGVTYGWTDVSSAPGSGIDSGTEKSFGVSYGLGAEYVFTPQLSVVLQYDEHHLKFVSTGRDHVSATTIGLRYRF